MIQVSPSPGNEQIYIGLPGDTKPVDGIGTGARLFILGSDLVYIWDGPLSNGVDADWKLFSSPVNVVGVIGGERNSGTTNNFDATHHEVNGSCFLDNVATLQTLNAGAPIYLHSLHVQVALIGTLTVTGFSKIDGVAVSRVYPIGTVGQLIAPGDAYRMEAGCTMQLSVANDGGSASNAWNVRVGWRSLG